MSLRILKAILCNIWAFLHFGTHGINKRQLYMFMCYDYITYDHKLSYYSLVKLLEGQISIWLASFQLF